MGMTADRQGMPMPRSDASMRESAESLEEGLNPASSMHFSAAKMMIYFAIEMPKTTPGTMNVIVYVMTSAMIPFAFNPRIRSTPSS